MKSCFLYSVFFVNLLSEARDIGMTSRNCTRCGLSVKGHPGQCGEKCQVDTKNFNFDSTTTTMSTEDEHMDDRDADAQGIDHASEMTKPLPVSVINHHLSDQSMAIRELSQHMLNLSVDMKGILEQNSQILSVLTKTKGPTVNDPPPTVTPDRSQAATGDKPRTYYLEGGAKLADSTYKNAISGEFINLVEFLPSTETRDLEAHVTDGELQFKPKKSKQSLDNFHTWLQAWNEFESVIMSVHPHLYNNLSTYRRFIQSMDRKYNWPAVYSYDLRFRTYLARHQSCGYHMQNNDLVVSILDATAIKTDLSRCFRCKSVDHVIQECPFPAYKVQVETPQKKEKRNTTQFRWYHSGKEGCNNFNYGKCNFPQCARAHVCKGCRGTEPYCTCSQCNRSSLAT